MRSFLVTGGCGFIGSHLADALAARGHRVRILDDLSTGRRRPRRSSYWSLAMAGFLYNVAIWVAAPAAPEDEDTEKAGGGAPALPARTK